MGRKHEPAYRLVLTNSKNSTKSGKLLEILGNFDARRGEESIFKADKITHWISKGAQTSDTVHNLLASKKIIEGKKINKLPLKKPIIKVESVKVESVKEETQIEEKVETPVLSEDSLSVETAPEVAETTV